MSDVREAEEPSWLPCLNCGKPADPDLQFCPACEAEMKFNLWRDQE